MVEIRHLIGIEENESLKLWQQRLDHMSEKWMKIMHSKRRIPILEFIEIDICEGLTCYEIENDIKIFSHTTPLKKCPFRKFQYIDRI